MNYGALTDELSFGARCGRREVLDAFGGGYVHGPPGFAVWPRRCFLEGPDDHRPDAPPRPDLARGHHDRRVLRNAEHRHRLRRRARLRRAERGVLGAARELESKRRVALTERSEP